VCFILCTHDSAAFKDCTLPRTFRRYQLTRNSEDAVFQIQTLCSIGVTDTETSDKELVMSVSVSNSNAPCLDIDVLHAF